MNKSISEQVNMRLEKYGKTVFELIDEVRDFIKDNDCFYMQIDVSAMNLIDSMKIVVMCSTYHFAKYPDGVIEWTLSDMQTLYYIRNLKLKNVKLSVKNVEDKTIKYFERNYRMSIH